MVAHRIITDVGIAEAFDPANPPTPLPTGETVRALWDTGATGCCISPALVQRLGLVATGLADVIHAGGVKKKAPTYIVNLFLPNKVGISGVRVSEFSPIPSFDVIIGMNVITMGDFAITNVNGKTVVSYQVPSHEEIDFVPAADRHNMAGTGRNDPCPCGSGKKYKKCHGRRA